MSETNESSGMAHLRKALYHAEKAVELFPEDSRQERVAGNAVSWTIRAIEIIEGREP